MSGSGTYPLSVPRALIAITVETLARGVWTGARPVVIQDSRRTSFAVLAARSLRKRVSQPTFAVHCDKLDLRHEFWPCPLHLGHLVSAATCRPRSYCTAASAVGLGPESVRLQRLADRASARKLTVFRGLAQNASIRICRLEKTNVMNESTARANPWTRIKEHKVLQWSLAYLGAALALAHGQELLSHTFHWPELVGRGVMAALIAGFPLAVALAWYHGHKGMTRVSAGEMTVIAILILIGAALLVALVRVPETTTAESPSSPAAARVRPPLEAAPIAFAPPSRSLAVLPFANMSGDPSQEYFSDGLSEELLNALSRIEALQVAARTSSFSFKGKDVDIATIAHKLNVATVLEGSIRRSGNTVRVTAQLINAVTGYHLWSQTYDRELKDALAVQTDVATAVARQLEVKLLGDELERIEAGATRKPEAHDAYLRGVHLYEDVKEDNASTREALAAFNEAIALDSSYAMAYVRKVEALLALAVIDHDTRAPEEAAKAAERAIALAPNLGEAHLALARVKTRQFDFRGAASEYTRALSLAPGSALVQSRYAIFARLMGDRAAALAAARRAAALDPENFGTRFDLASTLAIAGRYDEALAALRKLQATEPHSPAVSVMVGVTYLVMEQPEEARQECASDPMLHAVDNYAATELHRCLAMAYHALGRTREAAVELEELRQRTGDAEPVRIASVYAQWGDKATALHWLAIAEKARDPQLITLRALPALDPIRNEPEFKALEARLNFPP